MPLACRLRGVLRGPDLTLEYVSYVGYGHQNSKDLAGVGTIHKITVVWVGLYLDPKVALLEFDVEDEQEMKCSEAIRD